MQKISIDDLNEGELLSNIESLNEQKSLFQNAIQDIKKEIENEMSIKYSKILEQKIEEMHKTIFENVQKQNQTILDNYVKKFNDLEKEREEENVRLSQIMISNKSQMNMGDIPNKSICITVHNKIGCNNCKLKPIIGFRYKCSKCRNFNLCEKCEEKNEIKEFHQHNFIKISEEEKEKGKAKAYEKKRIKKLKKIKNKGNNIIVESDNKIIEKDNYDDNIKN